MNRESNLVARALIYGDIVDRQDRQRFMDTCSDRVESLDWLDEPVLYDSIDGLSLVFVDLDDQKYASPEFLMSLASGGKKVKLIGKSSSGEMEEMKKFAKLGISEVLEPERCLLRMDELLNELEQGSAPVVEQTSKFTTHALIGVSSQTAQIRDTVRLLSDIDFPSALILGETGTGKSLISKILHHSGVRSEHRLVDVNCSAIPDELFESELFGHVKGAFTDAKAEKAGLFDYAQNGTLFLDEVGNLSASAQAKLLKILEDKKLRKVGAVDEVDINVRVVAATNIDLEAAIKKGLFREDLYYRLNLLTIRIPPLRERPDDIPDIMDYYTGFYATNYGKPGISFDEKAVEAMRQHCWPGNVRELCNVIERAVLLSKGGPIRTTDIGVALKAGRISVTERQQIVIDIPSQGISLQEVEHHVVKQVLNMCKWNKSETAKFLGISRPRLRRIIAAMGLEQNRRED